MSVQMNRFINLSASTIPEQPNIIQVPTKRKCKGTGCSAIVIAPNATCLSCRAKRKAKRQEDAFKNATNTEIVRMVVGEDGKVKRKREDGATSDATTKRKKVQGIALDGENKRKSKPFVELKPGEMNEFQNELEMVKQLKKVAKRPTTFYACYSIVADPSVPYRKQATVVARNIKKSANISFNHKDVLQTETTSTSFSNIYRCTCHLKAGPSKKKALTSWLSSSQEKKGNGAPVQEDVTMAGPIAYPLMMAAPLVPSVADIRNKLAGSGTSSVVQDAPLTPCSGRIEVTAEEDRSHPLGILGQRIVVRIHHS
ncbi:hypothetical protein V5O48_008956 [Marasmius crinis-equi]|uniref:Uncharacterized protein n=1 Tax=Marasmius crinis-equi TaxID=585013 RepID=A0ABR3FCM6_9AGAR